MLSIGIVGLPNVGKSTLFNALTNKKAEAANYPFCTIDPNVGVVKVPDARLEKLARFSRSQKTVHTAIEFVDIAGLVKGASTGEGLGNKFLANIRECDAICEVIRNFQDSNIIHVHGRVDPLQDQETIGLELILADLESVNKRIQKTEKEAKSGNKEAAQIRALLTRIKSALDNGRPARSLEFTEEEKPLAKGLGLLTLKPVLYVVNGEKGDLDFGDGEILELNIKLEEEISALGEEEQREYIEELGLFESGLDKLIKASYKLLGLITFLTTGTDESRAWTVKAGSKAPEAAGVIHTDFIKGFVRAEVINWEKLLQAGSEAAAREKGMIRTEGKDYIVQDGDVCNFLVNK